MPAKKVNVFFIKPFGAHPAIGGMLELRSVFPLPGTSQQLSVAAIGVSGNILAES